MSFEISKLKDRCCIPKFISYVRSLPCCACGRLSTASHMKSVKYADGSDALAVNACMPTHHVASTRTSREILERAGINIELQHRKLWIGFCERENIAMDRHLDEAEFERLCELHGLREKPPTKRKANFR